MYLKRQMPLSLMIRWTRKTTLVLLANALVAAVLHIYFGLSWLSIPWSLVALVGTAVAFLISFQNNSAYDRVWEARKIWGGIVNETRAFSVFARDMVEDQEALRPLLYRHRAWLTALRFALREQKSWEIPMVTDPKMQERFNRLRYNPERIESLEETLKPLLSEEELRQVMAAPNKASSLLSRQSLELSQLKNQAKLWAFSYLELEKMIREFYVLQGKSERIKNFPYPRQYFTLGVHLTWAFILLLPYTAIPEFYKIGLEFNASMNIDPVWFQVGAIPFIVCVSWIFHTMGRMGRAGENPFEGTIHDVPISAISRTLEIEISHLLGEPKEQWPKPFPVLSDVQM